MDTKDADSSARFILLSSPFMNTTKRTKPVEMLQINTIPGMTRHSDANPFPDQPGHFRMIHPDEDLEEVGRQVGEHLSKFIP
jgi:hypothetical protein